MTSTRQPSRSSDSRRALIATCLTAFLFGSCQCAEDAPVAEADAPAPEPTAAPAAAPTAAPPAAAPAATPEVADYELVSGAWNVVSVSTPQGTVTASGPHARVMFTGDAVEGTDGLRFSGETGCNGLAGDYHATPGGELQVSHAMGSTNRDCSDEILAVEDALTMALTTASSYSISGDELTIRHDGGTITLKAGS